MLKPSDIVAAWFSVKDEWIVRRNKARTRHQWEVVRDWGGGLISDETQHVITVYDNQGKALDLAEVLENTARAEAVLKLLKDSVVLTKAEHKELENRASYFAAGIRKTLK